MRHIYLILCCIFMGQFTQAQITQTIRGTIIDKDDQQPLIGVAIGVIKGDSVLASTSTDESGVFRLPNIPVGRINIAASYIGYKKVYMSNVILNTGKELILNIEMESSVAALDEVEVRAGKPGETINEMATISARTFNVEETERYAGSRGDPARMASNFAGVNGSDDSRNDIVIRGNSPFGLLYRVEGVNIPNPNHFNIPGSVGGSVAILNNRMLSNSDFYTGAFQAEFGNANAGVFDIRMKKGNNEKHEFTGEFGLLGANIFGEGPFSKKKKSSYVFNYRYATLELLNAMGLDIGTSAIPRYTDLQFKMNFPTKNGGNLSVFGIGGYSNINLLTSKTTTINDRDIYASGGRDEIFKSGMGVVGMNYTRPINDRVYSNITFASSVEWVDVDHTRVLRHIDSSGPEKRWVIDSLYPKLRYVYIIGKLTGSFMRNYKLNTHHTIRFGLITDAYRFNFTDSNYNEVIYDWVKRSDTKRWDFLFQPYVQWKWNINNKLTVNAGLHGQLFTLNNSWSIEPRASIKYQFKQNQSVSAGVGLHSQMLPGYVYFSSNNDIRNYESPYNQKLDFMRSFHSVLSYDIFFKQGFRIKTEVYYQHLFNIPVDTFSSSFCVLNQGAGFERYFPTKLVNKGIGRNYGFEFTLEKFFTKNWFLLFTGSVYDAKYKPSDGKWYNSDFNGRYNLNVLGTKEFVWFGRDKQQNQKRINTFGIGGKVTLAGGKRYTTYDTTASKLSDDPVVMDAVRNMRSFKPYFRFDIKINYKCNTRKVTHEVGIDLVNVTFQKNPLRIDYVSPSEPEKVVYQLGFLPLFYYRIDFAIAGKKERG